MTDADLAQPVVEALRNVDGLVLDRCDEAVLARTETGQDRRVVLAAPLGAGEMTSSATVLLRLATTLEDPAYDVTYLFYDSDGLGQIAREMRYWLYGDLAVLLDPTGLQPEAGCRGQVEAAVRAAGSDPDHGVDGIAQRLAQYTPRRPVIEGLEFPEALDAAPTPGDELSVTVSFRYAPDRSRDDAEQFITDRFTGYDVHILGHAIAGAPGIGDPVMAAFVAAMGKPVSARLSWGEVARFAAFGIPAVSYGPADNPAEAARCEQLLRSFLAGG